MGCLREPLPPSGSEVRAHYLKQQPGNRPWLHERGIGGELDPYSPDRTGISRVLPGSTGRAILLRVRAQKMGDDLHTIVVEQGGLLPEQPPGKTKAGAAAYILLSARSMSQ